MQDDPENRVLPPRQVNANFDAERGAAGPARKLARRRGAAARSPKIVVKRPGNGHYAFFLVRDDRDHGTMIDFLQRRKKVSLGEVRQILRAWTGGPLPRPAGLPPSGQDRRRTVKVYRRMAVAATHVYLERERGIPPAVLSPHDLRTGCGWTTAAMRCFLISITRACGY
jgi:hypothetical protein